MESFPIRVSTYIGAKSYVGAERLGHDGVYWMTLAQR